MALSKLMTKEITSLPESATALDAAKFMTDMNVGSVIVEDGRGKLGMITDRDIMTKVMAMGKDPSRIMLGEFMTRPVATVTEDMDLIDATKMMSRARARRCPVVNSWGKVIGMIALDDILISIGEEMKNISLIIREELGK